MDRRARAVPGRGRVTIVRRAQSSSEHERRGNACRHGRVRGRREAQASSSAATAALRATTAAAPPRPLLRPPKVTGAETLCTSNTAQQEQRYPRLVIISTFHQHFASQHNLLNEKLFNNLESIV